jgi:hypothetical protein
MTVNIDRSRDASAPEFCPVIARSEATKQSRRRRNTASKAKATEPPDWIASLRRQTRDPTVGVEPYHFRRCVPSVTAQINPHPEPVRIAYAGAVELVFSSETEDVDTLKIEKEAHLRASLGKLGITEFARD